MIAVYYLLLMVMFASSGFAQACGPDPAPAQAAAAGYTCETFRWGSGDTISEIDTTGTGVPGKKFYLGTANVNGHATVGGDYSVDGTGKITIQTTEACPGANCGAFSLNTCFAPTGSGQWTGGNFFQNGYYVEFVGTWDATGHSGVQTGFYGTSINWPTSFPSGCLAQGGCYEVDNPDAYADDQELVFWGGGSFQGLSNTVDHVRHGDATVQTGHKFGAMTTNTAYTWWYDDTANGSVDFAGSLGGFVHPSDVYTSKQCFGLESTSPFPLNQVSLKVWQAPPPITTGGSSLLFRRR